MRLCNFIGPEAGDLRAGVALGEQIADLHALLLTLDADSEVGLDAFRTIGPEAVRRTSELIEWVGSADRAKLDRVPTFDGETVRFGPPVVTIPAFRDFYAFEGHVKTARRKRGLEMIPEWYELAVFYFSNAGAMVGHGDDVVAPVYGQWLDFELEVGVIIGKPDRDIPRDEALEHVAGLTILNDWSLRDVQRREMKVGLGPAKGKDFATSLGPYLVTVDELEDRRTSRGFDLAMTARLNGELVSSGNLGDLYHGIDAMIERASQGVELRSGDLIGTGTVGTGCILELGPETTGGWLGAGDVVELEVERLGVLRNRIIAAE